MFWWRQKNSFNAKRKIAQTETNHVKTQIIPFWQVWAEVILSLIGLSFTLKTGDAARVAFLDGFGMALICGCDSFDIWF